MREKLKVRDEASKAYLNRYERLLMQLTRHELDGHAEFLGDAVVPPELAARFPEQAAAIPLGLYELPRRSGEAHLYRLNHPLAEALVGAGEGPRAAAGGDSLRLRPARRQDHACWNR